MVAAAARRGYGVAVAQRGWVSADEVINTWPLDRLRKFLTKKAPPISRS